MNVLKIENLKVKVNGNLILKGLNLSVNLGEIHAIMGPNGTGKSTLANVLAGKPGYEIIDGSIEFDGKNLLEMEPEERAREGLFMAFQYPIEIPGVTNANFMKTAVNEIRKFRGLEPLDAYDFLQLMREKAQLVGLDPSFLNRNVNEGFSGGEKKRNEIFQLALLDPKLAILDETDSGLDIDAIKVVANGVNALRTENRSFLIITHYQRILNYIVPDFVHIMYDGQIVTTGDKSLAYELEAKGYDWLKNGNSNKN
ncbi:MAG: Fe-S cluster assembly ATPase SufC [Ignavibacteria bacterium]|nr:Fe-S cluster assembly ATPase SufC [Ignavibacteria bacterium]